MPPFKLTDVKRLRDQKPKRRRFVESTDNLNPDKSFTLSLKFESVADLFRKETGLQTLNGPFGPWARFTSDQEKGEGLEI